MAPMPTPRMRISRLAAAAVLAAATGGCSGTTLVHDARRAPTAGATTAVPTSWVPARGTTCRGTPPPPAIAESYEVMRYEIVRNPPADRPLREVSLTLPIWIPGVTGSFAEGSTSVDVDRPEVPSVGGAAERATSLEFALVGRLDVRRDRFVAFADVFGVRIGKTADYQANGFDSDGSLEGIIGRVLVGHRVVQACPDPCRTAFDFDILGGARVYYVEAKLDEPDALSFSAHKTWIDPIVAVRASIDPPGPFDFSVMADVGGFGAGSEVSWSVSLEAHWRFARHWSLMVGWAWLAIDYDLGANDDRFVVDIRVGGPQIGITYVF
jgi:hypothetical protein